MDFSPPLFDSRSQERNSSSSAAPSRSGGIVDILGMAENIVNGVNTQDIGSFPNGMSCPPLRIGAPIMQPLESALEPTPLAPTAFLAKFMGRRAQNSPDFALSANPKWANMPYKMQPQQVPSQPQSVVDHSINALDAAPFFLEDADDFEAPPLVSSDSSFSSSELSMALNLGQPEQKQKKRRVRKYKEDQWQIRYEELLKFRDEEGHVMVPHSYPKNQKLAQWVKRQRYQKRLKSLGKHSTLSPAREHMLDAAGFIWDSHKNTWQEHFQELQQFAMEHGHCYVPPSLSKEKSSLITWMKHQRRQYKRYMAGMDSTMTSERIQNLENIGFDWDPRNLSQKKSF